MATNSSLNSNICVPSGADFSEIEGPHIVGFAPSFSDASKQIAHTLEHVEKAVEFYQWMLQVAYPWSSFKIVFSGGLVRPFYALSGGVLLLEYGFDLFHTP